MILPLLIPRLALRPLKRFPVDHLLEQKRPAAPVPFPETQPLAIELSEQHPKPAHRHLVFQKETIGILLAIRSK